MLKKFFASKLYRIFDYAMRLILLNVMTFIASLLLPLLWSLIEVSPTFEWVNDIIFIPMFFTLIPSIVSVVDTIRGYELDLDDRVFKTFLINFSKNYRVSMKISVILLIVAIPLYNSFTVFNSLKTQSIANAIGYILTISLVVIIIFITMHLILVVTYFRDLRLIDAFKLAATFAFKDIFGSILILAAFTVALVIAYLNSWFLVLFSISLPLYALVKITKNKYKRIYDRVENNFK